MCFILEFWQYMTFGNGGEEKSFVLYNPLHASQKKLLF